MPYPCPLPNPSPTTRSSINLAVSRVINFCLSLIEATELDKSNQNYLHINTIPLFFKRRGEREGCMGMSDQYLSQCICVIYLVTISVYPSWQKQDEANLTGAFQVSKKVFFKSVKWKTPLKANPLF